MIIGPSIVNIAINLVALFLAASTTSWTGQQPQLATDGTRMFLAFARDNGIAVLQARGDASFSERSTIAVSGKMAAGMRRGPRIAVTSRAVLVSAVAGEKGGGADGDVVLFRSTDDGRTWSPSTVINDVSGSAREGMHGMAANRGGVVAIAWLDLRERGTRIFAAISRDHGVTWSRDVLVYASPSGSVCECCHPSVAVDDRGTVAVMFRNQIDGRRDMYLTRSRDGSTFEPAVKIGTGTWVLDACPMDGGDLELTPNGAVTIWRREDVVYMSDAADPEQRVAAGRDAVVAVAGSRRDIAWSSPEGVLVRRAGRTHNLGPGRFPVLLAFPNSTVVAWEDRGQVKVGTL
ncbi:MAG TPA: sialidase family protein, partial [Vicinamibacterales bacterium]|nr:sialidase family protein [Vicinamibacterales bacterium]